MVRPVALRDTFDEAPELYDRVRPGYPEAVFEDLTTLARLRPGSRVLELGCGTGQATVPLATRGFEVVAIELGAGLAEVARRNLAAFPEVDIVNAAFEEWPLPPASFDAVVAATSFHWLDAEVRLAKVADALRSGGALAIIATHHVAGGDGPFFAEVQRCYETWMAGTVAGLRLPEASEVAHHDDDDFEASGLFTQAVFRRYERDLTYSTREYRDLLLSYSGHRALARDAREGLLACIGELIDARFGGRVAKRYMTELTVAYRRPPE
jgi:SAM-dependent methyltransferase